MRACAVQGLEGREGVAIIVDDTSRVWPAHARNLLPVERYLWFPSAMRHFGFPGPSLMEQHRLPRSTVAEFAGSSLPHGAAQVTVQHRSTHGCSASAVQQLLMGRLHSLSSP